MSKNEQINKLIEETLNSLDNVTRAEAKPYLLTRINARLSKVTESAWERAGRLIARPAVAFTGLCMVLLINVMVVMFNKSSSPATATEQAVQAPADEFSYTVATIYDNENTQP